MNYQQKFNYTMLVAAIASFLQSAESSAAVQYTVTDLGTLGGTYSLGLGINENGGVTGLSHGLGNINNQAFLYGSDGTSRPLGTLLGGSYSQGTDINNFNDITGQASLPGNATYHAFVWQNAQAHDLGTLDLLTGTGSSLGVAINDSQLVAGFSSVNGGTAVHAVVWTKDATNWKINDLGTLDRAGGTGSSQANGLNETGQVTGSSTVPASSAQHAVVWTKGTTDWTATDLGTLGGNFSSGFAINSNGEVTGSATTALDAEQHAFLAQSAQNPPAMTDLKTLGGSFSEGHGINSAGDVVGYSTTVGDGRQAAFLWQSATGMQDLNSLIDPATGWRLLEARAISDKGDITGIGVLNGENHAFLLTRQSTDTTPPLVSFQITPPAPSASGWYLTAPSIAWTVTDPESAISSKVGCAAVASLTNTAPAGQSFSCTATSDGGSKGPVTTPPLKVDTTQPTLAGVPAAFTQQATNLAGTVINYAAPTASDANSGVSPTGVSCAPASGTAFPMGPSTVNCTVLDNAGNAGIASFIITVADLIPPSFSVCPATVALTEGQTLPQPTATDNLSTPVVTGGATSLPVGTTTVNWTATDLAGLSATCVQQVTVTAAPTTEPPPPVEPQPTTETIAVSKAECKRLSATSGEWSAQGITSNVTNNSIQLYSTTNVPADLSSNKLGASVVPDKKGQWQFQAKSGPSCTAPISLRSAAGKVLGNIPVAVK